MKNIKVYLYHEKNGGYSCYMDETSDLEYGLKGEGKSVQEAIADWNAHYEGMREFFKEEGREFTEAEFSFAYDVVSLLHYYAGRFTFSGLSKITGVSAAQLSQYANGYRNPSPKTTAKIETALHTFGKELCQVTLV
jgi:hypothetical protein